MLLLYTEKTFVPKSMTNMDMTAQNRRILRL